MEDYTKYKLKASEELAPFLAETDNIFVIACNKCFKQFENVDEPDCDEFLKIAADAGKKVTGCTKIDFVCNSTQTERKLKDIIPEGTGSVWVVSCGLGIQTVAGMTDLPVYSATNSLNYKGHHGMALTKKRCDACAQCYLNMTGGVCPIVDCSKSLVNGQCGGAKNGKCEVNPEMDCAWEKIEQRLASQGRVDELKKQPVQLRDYSKINFKVINDYVQAIRDNRFAGFYGGIHPSEKKELAEHEDIKVFPEPEYVTIPLGQHSGKPAEALVAVGDYVKVGQKIGAANGFISANVHSSVSGTVTAIEPTNYPVVKGADVLAVTIKSDGKNVIDESVKPHKSLDELTPEEIVEIVKEAGIVGMGGAGFPMNVKLMPGKPIDYVLLNGSECEPYLTADHRVLLAYADEIVFGLKAIMKAVNAPKGVILIEDNKPDAIELLESKVADIPNIEVVAARTKYPEGAEKMLIKRVTGRMVPSGGLPADVGCVVSNVSSTKAVADAIQKGMPLIERVVTVSGEHIPNPGNFLVKVGTSFRELAEYCGGVQGDDVTIKAGGAMMGIVLSDLDVPVIKGTNGLIAIDTDHSTPVDCIKCGRCVDVCPMELEPLYFAKYVDTENWEGLKEKNLMDCMECRSCQYICSSKIPLFAKIQAGKAALRGMK